MKTLFSALWSRDFSGIPVALGVLCVLLAWSPFGIAIPLTGANGKTVEFAGVKSATPKGLLVQIKEGDDLIGLGWDKFDLQKVRAQYPEIDAAYKKSLGGETTELNLGSFAPKKPDKPMAPQLGGAKAAEKLGYYEVNSGGATFAAVIPSSGNPRGILLLSRGQNGLSLPYMARVRETGPWTAFQKELNFAVLSYDFDVAEEDQGKAAPYIFAENGSGEALLGALDALSEKTGADLSNLPIAIYGTDMLGAAFAYNFTQWKPERVIAAVVAKGGFYATPPTAESVKVPLLMIWGEYNGEPKVWNATHTHAEIFGNHVNLKPNWIYAMEPRGQNDESPEVSHFGQTFLKQMIEKRMTNEGLAELDRSEAWVGDLENFDLAGKLEDPEKVLPSTETWLPNEEFAEMWKQFILGQMPIPAAEAAPE